MASSEPDYGAMDLEMPEEEAAPDATALDDEFLMHAEAAGFDAVKAEALKLAIERCVELKSQGSYDVETEDDEEADEE